MIPRQETMGSDSSLRLSQRGLPRRESERDASVLSIGAGVVQVGIVPISGVICIGIQAISICSFKTPLGFRGLDEGKSFVHHGRCSFAMVL